jgi:hypothetical protein
MNVDIMQLIIFNLVFILSGIFLIIERKTLPFGSPEPIANISGRYVGYFLILIAIVTDIIGTIYYYCVY